ncbi:MAG: formate/nitrite transporter family protein [Nannocystaceae bacterium]
MADGSDAYAPSEIAHRVEALGVAKARAPVFQVCLLAGLAGAFISLGAVFFTVVVTGSELGFGPTRLIGGVSFSLGLVLVVVAGAELFTGNNLVAMAWASGKLRFVEVLRNWVVVYLGNVAGAVATVALVFLADTHSLSDGQVGVTAVSIGAAKCALPLMVAFSRGVLCNALVCLAVWLAMGSRTVTDKLLAVLFPVTAFVAAGFEHSIANWFFLPYALVLEASTGGTVLVREALLNLVVVTAGNIVGGTFLVAGVYGCAYLRDGAES